MVQLSVLVIVFAIGVGAPFWFIQHHTPLPGEKGCVVIQNEQSRWECYGHEYAKWINEPDRDARLQRLDQVVRTNQRLENDCHEGMHYAAKQLIEEDGVDPFDLLTSAAGSSNCTRGLQHGLMESTIEDRPKVFQQIVAKLCVESEDPVERFNCYHGIGHTYVTTTDTIDEALDACRALEQHRKIDGCLDGAFMQHNTNLEGYDTPRAGFFETCERALPNELERCGIQATGAFTEELGITKAAQSREVCTTIDEPLLFVGCLTATVFERNESLLGWCAGLRRDDYIARCSALAIGMEQSAKVPRRRILDTCNEARQEAVVFACGVMLAGYLVDPDLEPELLTRGDADRLTSACDALDRRYRDGCISGVLTCYPRSSSYTFVRRSPVYDRCMEHSARQEPFDLKLEGETIPSVYDTGFDEWYASVNDREDAS